MALTARDEGGFALVASTLGRAEASRRALARHRAALGQSRRLCEELIERLGWLQRPDDPGSIPEVIGIIRSDAAALEVCVGRVAVVTEQPCGHSTEHLAALVEAIDAEVRLVTLGDPAARFRARHLAFSLRTGAALARDRMASVLPQVVDSGPRGRDTAARSI